LLILLLLITTLNADERYAFVYSKNIDDQFINFYDKVIVEADNIDNIYAIRYPQKMVAYVSVGEIEPWRKSQAPYEKKWIISQNKTWNSLIADLRKEAYQEFIFKRIKQLYQKGYRNFFLDTMDAYHVTAKNKKLFAKQQQALVAFVHKLHQKYPHAKLIINRGFEILEKIQNDISAVVAESLLARYDHANKTYLPVPKTDRAWLLGEFKKAKKMGLDVISIEYSDQNSTKRLEIAKKIKEMGIIPYVTDGLLQEQGECDVERIRRNVLILFNQSLFKDNNSVYSDVHLLAAMPLEHLGYIPILYDIATQPLPKSIEDKYHAVIVWSYSKTDNNEKLYEWSQQCRAKGVKILFLNNFVFTLTPERLKEFGLSTEPNRNSFLSPTKLSYKYGYHPYEKRASIEFEEQLFHSKNSKDILSLRYQNGQTSTPIAITPWGGYARGNSFLLSIGNESFWTIDPFKFFQEALRLDTIPVPDPTTEAGRRILFTHVDGDGFMEVVRTDPSLLSTEYLIDKIYRKYPIPQTVSLIEGEVSPQGLYPKLSQRMQQIAKELYKIPWIQPASHTLSHPFFWGEADEEFKKQKAHGKKPKTKRHVEKGHGHLPIPNYPHFNLQRETKDSVAFALSFAPKNKQQEKILFWSGDCLPTKIVLAYVEREGILAMNGGDTTIKKAEPWLSHVAPYGLQREEYWQIYTGEQNENVYTNDWLGPFWGYRNAIDTFELTEKPRRLKPINIYYHFYSGSKLASLKALEEVYDWAVAQKTSKLYASQYIKKARGFYRTAIAKLPNGYEIRNSGYLRTVRFDQKVNINLAKSNHLAGFVMEGNRTYVTLDKHPSHLINTTQSKTKIPYLIDSNGWVEQVKKGHNQYHFTLKSNVGLEANFYLPKGCYATPPKGFKTKRSSHTLKIISPKKRGATVVFECQ
jgi:hypothetical protein